MNTNVLNRIAENHGGWVLCQDCLKVKPYTDARHDGDEPCECGGDFCGCPFCQETIKEREGN